MTKNTVKKLKNQMLIYLFFLTLLKKKKVEFLFGNNEHSDELATIQRKKVAKQLTS
jgi:hypothetical protein